MAERIEMYRDKAAYLRHLADMTRFPDSRRELLRLAESFERLAAQVEAWNDDHD